MANKNLQKARKAKNDEFYTQMGDIEKELQHYEKHFENKTVYCNCDDPRISNFFQYFSMRFEHLKLKKLFASCYKNQDTEMFSENKVENAIYLEYKRDGQEHLIPYPEYMERLKQIPKYKKYKGDPKNPNIPQPEDIGIGIFEGNGGFENEKSIELLQKTDIVVTNPPFSLFREYIAQLIKYNKKFLIIGNINAVTYKEVFKLIKENKIWLGASIKSGDREFGVPDYYPLKAAGFRIDEDNNKFIRVKGVRWYTNLEHEKRNEELILWEKYTPEKYPKYDNYDAININKTLEIPKDYEGVMGVPITFLDKYNPKQFEIIGSLITNNKEFYSFGVPYVHGKKVYARILIKRK